MKIYMTFVGVGFGHGSRSLAIAKALQKRGHEVTVGTHEPVYEITRKIFRNPVKITKEFDAFQDATRFFKWKSVLYNLMYSPRWLKVIASNFKRIAKIQPDLIISDFYFSTLFVSMPMSIPRIAITNDTVIKWVISDMAGKRAATMLESTFNQLLNSCDRTIVPDFPMPNTLCEKNMIKNNPSKKISYTGPIIRHYPSRLVHHDGNKKTVLITSGSEIKLGVHRKLSSISKKHGINFIIFNSGREAKKNGLVYKKFVLDPWKFYENSDAVITHGGHTTLMECCSYGLPVFGLATKGMFERENNLAGVQKHGLGFWTYADELGTNLEDNILKILEPKYKRKAEQFAKLARKHNGVKNAVKLVEKLAR